ncbi:MAG: type II toxin-antitoxin system VapC family toxin [Alphaproteobacteria bacterium]|jgi:ribonuclease VapC
MQTSSVIAVDTSVVVAILEAEDDAELYEQAIEGADDLVMSAATFVELNAVMWHRRGRFGRDAVDAFIQRAAITIMPLTAAQSYIARDAKAAFSVLNFGDAFSYALAKDLEVPLLFKGNDFSQTDIMPA